MFAIVRFKQFNSLSQIFVSVTVLALLNTEKPQFSFAGQGPEKE
jgi:hypothetical protein